MKIETFDLERGQSLWEHVVELNLSESGVHPATPRELGELGLDLEELLDVPLAYVQTNGTPELRSALAVHYPGSTPDSFLVTNGSAEANYVLATTLLEPGDPVLVETPNYLQVHGLARNLGADVATFPLCREDDWRPDWDAWERGLAAKPKLVYLSHPNNPTGKILEPDEMERIVAGVEEAGAWLIADEVYRGAELDGVLSPSFWGLSDRVLVVSGLSKAYGLPGTRIGWLVAPEELADRCWHLRDYTTIAPGALSDRIARFAVEPGVKERLHARARSFMVPNRDLFRDWIDTLGGALLYNPPRAGAYGFVRYELDLPSEDLCTRIRERRDVLLVAGSWMGMENYLRISLGTPRVELEEGLGRIARELQELGAMPAVGAGV